MAAILQIVATLRTRKDWNEYFSMLAARDANAKLWIDNFADAVALNLLGRDSTSGGYLLENDGEDGEKVVAEEEEAKERCIPFAGIHDTCKMLSGELVKCNACGKVEEKMGQWKKCAKCGVVRYCSRECQRKDWKSHRKPCARLAEKFNSS